jgi:hypothetical protein
MATHPIPTLTVILPDLSRKNLIEDEEMKSITLDTMIDLISKGS